MNRIVFKILRYSGLPWLFRQFVQRNSVSILLFHEVDIETADRTFSYLKKKYNIIDLNFYIDACKENDNRRLPNKSLIITFDDGLVSNYEMLPIIRKHNIPITIFLCSSIVNTNRCFWYKYPNLPISLTELKKLSNGERLETMREFGFEQDKEYQYPQALSKEQVLEMKDFVNMQSHTKFHPCLPNCSFEEAKEEILESKKNLEKEYGLMINSLAFPNGDYSERDIKLVKEAGYSCAITVDYGYNTLKSDLFRLKRLSVNDTKDLNELVVKSTGLWAFLKMILGKTSN